MAQISRVVVVGAGITGLTAATALRHRGVEVLLLELREGLNVGHGLTIQGNALLALSRIGVAERIIERGFPFTKLRLRQADGDLITEIPTPPMGGPDLPGTCGALRSDVLEILMDAAVEAGVEVRLGSTITAYDDRGDSVLVTLADGSTEAADLLVVADGIRSQTRRLLGIEDEPRPVGMGIWRVVADRPAHMDCSELYFGGPKYKAGYTPISEDSCYAFLLEENLERSLVGDRPTGRLMKQHGEGYGGTWGEVRDSIADDAPVNYQWIETINVPDPWFKGRAIAIGDAVHACPPLIAQGAAMCAEDAVILADMLTGDDPVEAVLPAFMARRMPRVQTVLDNSLALAAYEIDPIGVDLDPGALMAETLHGLCEPA